MSLEPSNFLNCIVCDVEVPDYADVMGGNNGIQPYSGTAFRSYGHYGSTVFDPMNGTYLEFVVCDSCLIKRKAVLLGTGLDSLG